MPGPDLSYAVHYLAPAAGAPACSSTRGHHSTARPADVTCRACKRTLAWRAAIAQARAPGRAELDQIAAGLEAKAQATVALADQAREFGRADLCDGLAQLAGELHATAQSFRRLALAETAGRGQLAGFR